jgi:putative redox protein
MQVKVKQADRFRFEIEARSHTVVCDQPVENGGEDAGMTPPEFLLASLGACAEFYAVQYLRTRKLDDRGVEVIVTAEKLLQPARLGNFRVRVTCPTALSVEQTEGLQRSVHHCLIHNTLLSTSKIDIDVAVGVPVQG